MTKLPFKQHIADLAGLLSIHGVQHVVICPGSRNAPLIQVFQRDPHFTCHSIVDERSAGYVSLGMARETRKPVAVVTTSGTAALNLAPAVAEAYNLQLPLIILTADRPPEFPPQFTNQRINQEGIYGRNVLASLSMPMNVDNEAALNEYVSSANQVLQQAASGSVSSSNQVLQQAANSSVSSANQVLQQATSGKLGPVHLNIPLEEPLYEVIGPPRDNLAEIIDPPHPATESGQKPNMLLADSDPGGGQPLSDELQGLVEAGKPILLVAGMKDYTEEEAQLLEDLQKLTRSALLTENLSNLSPAHFITHPELLLASIGEMELTSLQPAKVLLFGGQIVSRKTRVYIQGLDPELIHVHPEFPASLFRKLIKLAKIAARDVSFTNDYLASWKHHERLALEHAAGFLEDASFSALPAAKEIRERTPENPSFSALTATHKILENIPEGATVHLGNSTSIRYAQLCRNRDSLTYHGNRGTSGIDGSLSSAVGAAMVSTKLHVAILGDLSFVYDSNALWNRNFPPNLKIIVLNDQGGGIFRLLDGPDRMPFFEDYSVAHHPVNMKLLAEAFTKDLIQARSFDDLHRALDLLFQEDRNHTVLEVGLSNSENSRIFKQFYKYIHNQ